MAQVATTIRLDYDMKRQFEALCDDFGMNLNTAINIFVKTVVRKKAIPFKIEAEEQPTATHITARLQDVITRLREQAEENGTLGMSLEEINAEIEDYRSGK